MHSTGIMTRAEIELVLKRQTRCAKRSLRGKRNLAIFRLSCCLGLRASEIAGLCLKDMNGGPRPVIRVRAGIAKGKKARTVPLWWDDGTMRDIVNWVTLRKQMGAQPDDPLVCAVYKGQLGNRLAREGVAEGWKTAIRWLGGERRKQLSIHKGRHTFCTHALLAGVPITSVRDAAGHGNISTTNTYLHALAEDKIQNIFGGK